MVAGSYLVIADGLEIKLDYELDYWIITKGFLGECSPHLLLDVYIYLLRCVKFDRKPWG